MTDQQTLQAVIEKAVKNGWNQNEEALNLFHVIQNTVNKDGCISIDPEYWILNVWLNYIIFDFKFAKALWGEGPDSHELNLIIDEEGCDTKGEAWQSHLQQLVLAENRIEYLKQFVD
ncbi:hypothetical protein KBA63_00115 [Candidatus Woesebacteria bacterium]|nr:hypothetical protein [Candidatus Woesebacteria bacterium]